MKSVIWKIIELFFKFSRKDKKLITFLFKGYSGSNISPIIDKLENGELKNYKIKIFRVDRVGEIEQNDRCFKGFLNKMTRRFEYLKYLYKSELIISTHGCPRVRKSTKLINLWHGVPFKGMSLMNKSQSDKVGHIQDDYFITTSSFINTVMNSCIGIKSENYQVLGYPRNDYLFNEDGHRYLEIALDKQIKQKVILYTPTFQDRLNDTNSFLDKKENNFFGFENFSLDEFNKFLTENNIIFLLKLHPNDEFYFKNIYKNFISENIILLEGNQLEKHRMDLYKLINSVDLLVTDLSSIYFDYLLLDRPIIFIPANLQEYRESRGLLLEPYNFWTPGPKCLKQNEFQIEIIKSLGDSNYYGKERKNIKNIMHEYQDGKSTDRVISLIKEAMVN